MLRRGVVAITLFAKPYPGRGGLFVHYFTHCFASTSASFPLPSSPHWAPRTAHTRLVTPAALALMPRLGATAKERGGELGGKRRKGRGGGEFRKWEGSKACECSCSEKYNLLAPHTGTHLRPLQRVPRDVAYSALWPRGVAELVVLGKREQFCIPLLPDSPRAVDDPPSIDPANRCKKRPVPFSGWRHAVQPATAAGGV
jgi:hypothetical protein